MLEFFSTLILMADFGNTSQTDLIYNSELIEHKINLLLLLFDLRGKNSMNISEIIMMLQTAIQSLQKVFSQTGLFKNEIIMDEIKVQMLKLFGERLEQAMQQSSGSKTEV